MEKVDASARKKTFDTRKGEKVPLTYNSKIFSNALMENMKANTAVAKIMFRENSPRM